MNAKKNEMKMEETFTDKEFCKAWKIDRATSARWREDRIVSFVKLPNGQIRYKQSHVDELSANFEKLGKLGMTLKDVSCALKSGVVSVGVPERSSDVGVPEDASNFGNGKSALHEAGSAGVA